MCLRFFLSLFTIFTIPVLAETESTYFQESFEAGVCVNGKCILVGGYRPGWENNAWLNSYSFIAQSDQHTDWKITSFGGYNGLWSIAHGNSMFVAVGEGGFILRSKDGQTWEPSHLPNNANDWLMDIHWANGLFVAVGTRSVYASEDGKTWELVSKDGNFYGVTHAAGMWVAVGYGGKISRSSDGRTWQPCQTDSKFMLRGIAYGHGRWVAIGGEGRHGMVTSTDGIKWHTISSGSNAQLMDIKFTQGVFILVGRNREREQKGTLEYSYDGLNWTTLFDISPESLDMICEMKGGWLLGGKGGYLVYRDQEPQRLIIAEAWTPSVEDRGENWISANAPIRPFVDEVPSLAKTDTQKKTTTDLTGLLSLPQIKVTTSDQNIILEWESSKNHRYFIRKSNDMTNWHLVDSEWEGNDDTLRYEEKLETPDKKIFYRLEVYQAD